VTVTVTVTVPFILFIYWSWPLLLEKLLNMLLLEIKPHRHGHAVTLECVAKINTP
jgi:hypothetical protein